MNVKDDMYFITYHWMISQLRLKGSALNVYAVIYAFSHKGDKACSGSLPYISEMLGCTKQTVINAVKLLEKQNLIIKEQTRDNDGGIRNHYRVNLTILKAKKIISIFEQNENSKNSGEAEKPEIFTPPVKNFECPQSKNLNAPSQKTLMPPVKKLDPYSNNIGVKDLESCEGDSHARKENKQTFGELKNVHLSADEYNSLSERFGKEFLEKEIFSLSTYMSSKKKNYSNHYATLLKWCTQDREKQSSQPKFKYAFDKASYEHFEDDYEIFLNNFEIASDKKTTQQTPETKKEPEFTRQETEDFQHRMEIELFEPQNVSEERTIIDYMSDNSDKRYSLYFRQAYKVKYDENIPYFENNLK